MKRTSFAYTFSIALKRKGRILLIAINIINLEGEIKIQVKYSPFCNNPINAHDRKNLIIRINLNLPIRIDYEK